MPRVGSSSSSTSGCGQHPAAENDLLLVAAGKRVDFGLLVRGLDAHGFDARCPSRSAIFLSLRNGPFKYFFRLAMTVFARISRMPRMPGRTALLRHQRKAVFDGFARGLVAHQLAIHINLAAFCASRCRRCFPAARCVRSRPSPATPRISPLLHMNARISSGASIRPSGPSTFKMSSVPTTLSFGGKRLVSSTADHQADDFVHGQLLGRDAWRSTGRRA